MYFLLVHLRKIGFLIEFGIVMQLCYSFVYSGSYWRGIVTYVSEYIGIWYIVLARLFGFEV